MLRPRRLPPQHARWARGGALARARAGGAPAAGAHLQGAAGEERRAVALARGWQQSSSNRPQPGVCVQRPTQPQAQRTRAACRHLACRRAAHAHLRQTGWCRPCACRRCPRPACPACAAPSPLDTAHAAARRPADQPGALQRLCSPSACSPSTGSMSAGSPSAGSPWGHHVTPLTPCCIYSIDGFIACAGRRLHQHEQGSFDPEGWGQCPALQPRCTAQVGARGHSVWGRTHGG